MSLRFDVSFISNANGVAEIATGITTLIAMANGLKEEPVPPYVVPAEDDERNAAEIRAEYDEHQERVEKVETWNNGLSNMVGSLILLRKKLEDGRIDENQAKEEVRAAVK